MQHPDCDDLALLALDESVGDAIDAHVTGCKECAAEVQAFRTTVGLAALSNYGENAPQPGEHVWQAIATELALDDSPAAGDLRSTHHDAGGVPGSAETGTGGAPTGTPPSIGPATVPPVDDTGRVLRSVPDPERTPPTELSSTPWSGPGVAGRPGGRSAEPRHWSRWVAPLAAVIAGIAVGAGAVIVSQNRTSDVTIEAIAALTPVPEGPLEDEQDRQIGEAELVASSSGSQVRVQAPDLPPSSNAYEVWLFGNEGRMVSLGTLNNGTGTFTVPNGISTAEYRTVDVSDEPPNGNPAHSGVSLVRGEFS